MASANATYRAIDSGDDTGRTPCSASRKWRMATRSAPIDSRSASSAASRHTFWFQ